MLQPMENGPEPSPEATIKVDREEAIFNAARTLPVGDREAYLNAACGTDAQPGVANVHGQRYIIDVDMLSQGRTVRIRSTWIVRIGEELPRLTSCYVL